MDERQTSADVVRLMFGEAAPTTAERAVVGPARETRAVFRVRGLAVEDRAARVCGIDLDLAGGEILGIAGIDGNGQKQFAEALAGQRSALSGSILLEGKELAPLDVGARRKLGLRYMTDDRLGEGTVGSFSVAMNLLLKQIGEPPFWSGGLERKEAIA